MGALPLKIGLSPAIPVRPAARGPWPKRVRSKKAHRHSWYMPLLGVLLALLIPAVAVAAAPGPGGGQPPLVSVAPVTIADVNPPSEYIGHVEAIQAVDLRARVEGYLEEVNFREGDTVPSGKSLYQIEQAPYLAEVAIDKAQLAHANAELTRANQQIKRLRSALAASIPAMDLDEAAAAQLRAQAQVEIAQATLERALLDLDYTTIRAPISGRIGRTAYTRGNVVGPASNPLARIVQVDPVRVVYSLSDNDPAAIQMTMTAAAEDLQDAALIPRLRLADGTLVDKMGRIDFVDNAIDAATGTIAVRAEFDNPDGLLIPGQYVTVLITRSDPKRLPVIPQAAVLLNQQGSYVLVVDSENIARTRPIVLGPALGSMWAVESGLKADERVIVDGVQKVKPDAAVQIGPAQPQEP